MIVGGILADKYNNSEKVLKEDVSACTKVQKGVKIITENEFRKLIAKDNGIEEAQMSHVDTLKFIKGRGLICKQHQRHIKDYQEVNNSEN